MLRILRLVTAGESHGSGLTALLDGIPAGLSIDTKVLDRDLERRQQGYGRGGRMKIESDHAQILAGVRHGRTLGGPIAILVANRDAANWKQVMAVGPVPPGDEAARALTRPRPGHADLAGALKYDTHDARDILERAS
ncbi:MAG TPA: chorismate synthase, partial [Candidatus Polarisedimenticolia bacterium]|nr:chorismate synthase [Candidatus Polarisedimenticolia bacterium]